MIAKTDIKVFTEIGDDRNRLRLNFIKLPPPKPFLGVAVPDPICHNFHSLVWEVADVSTWIVKAIITPEDLQTERSRRWINEVHSLDPGTGSAIIRMGEDFDWSSVVEYSWREWDLGRNIELRMIRKCDPWTDWSY